MFDEDMEISEGKQWPRSKLQELNYLEDHMTRIMEFTMEQINYCYKVAKISYYNDIKRESILALVRRILF